MQHIAIFASGSGTNAENIIRFFMEKQDVAEVVLVLSNKSTAPVLEKAANLGVGHLVFTREQLNQTGEVLTELQNKKIDFIVLAGFLWLIPDNIIKAYPFRIINIHPALLPKFGGPGMYGMKVHETILASGENESGITIHSVNEK